MGKGTLLKRAAEHLSEVSEQAKRATEELSKRDQEKQDLVVRLKAFLDAAERFDYLSPLFTYRMSLRGHRPD